MVPMNELDPLLPIASSACRRAGMSASAFHQHFKAVTSAIASLSPLQFQKYLRPIEARRLKQSQGASAGYESVPQFTREYRRVFGKTPAPIRGRR